MYFFFFCSIKRKYFITNLNLICITLPKKGSSQKGNNFLLENSNILKFYQYSKTDLKTCIYDRY